MLGMIESVLIILFQVIFSGLAIMTQRAALLSSTSAIPHAIAWAVEVFFAGTAFLVLTLFSSVDFAVVSFIIGVLTIIVGSIFLMQAIKK